MDDKAQALVAAAAEAMRDIGEMCNCVTDGEVDCVVCHVEDCPIKRVDEVLESFPDRAQKILQVFTEAQMLEHYECQWQSAMDSRCPDACDQASELKSKSVDRIIELVRELTPIGVK